MTPKAFANSGYSMTDEEYLEASRRAIENDRVWFKCSHCEHVETGMTRVYCKHCGQEGHWAYDKEKGRVIKWES
jgi:Zn finger protein HypA/HybF involved in hydrogenase expression